jgi:hypothetical protein
MGYTQEQNYSVALYVGGDSISTATSLGVWDKFEGGEIDSETKTYRPGGMADAEVIAGLPATGEVTISKGFNAEKDGVTKKWLNSQIGKYAAAIKTPLKADKTAIKEAQETYVGVIKSVKPSTHDSEGDNVSMIEVTLTVKGLPS